MRIGALTKCDLIDIKDTFNDTHPGVKATLFASNSDGVLHIYVEKQCDDGGAIEVSGEMEYSKFQHSNSPIAAICFELESVYQELIADEEEEGDDEMHMVPCMVDVNNICNSFMELHPEVTIQYHVRPDNNSLNVRITRKDDNTCIDRIILFDTIFASNEPSQFFSITIENIYNDLMKDKDYRKILAQALKIVINSVYGYTSAAFDNPFRDPRNKEKEEMPIKNSKTVDNDFMLKMAKCAVASWYNTHGGPRKIKPEDVYIVWFCKTLQNWKALASTDISDGMYYEVTYDGDKDVAYVDAYKKWDNQEMLGENLREELFTSKVDIRYVGEKE